MGLRNSRTDVELMIKLLDYDKVKAKLKELENTLKNDLAKSAKKGSNRMRRAIAGTFGFLMKPANDFLRTLKSAFYRTFSYGIINIVRKSMADVGKSIKDSADVSLNFARVAAIMSRGGDEVKNTYDSLVTSILRADANTMLFTNDIKELGLALAKGGVESTEAFTEAMNVLNGLVGASGEAAGSLTLQFLKLAKAFGISKSEYGALGDVLYTASTSATTTIGGLLAAAANVGPKFKGMYGAGIESAKKFTVSVAAASQQGMKESRVGTSMGRMMDKLSDPTKKAARAMASLGINLYKDVSGSAKFSSALRRQSRYVQRLEKDLTRLVNTERMYVGSARNQDKLVGIRENIASKQAEINGEIETSTRLLAEFSKAGGGLKVPIEMIDELRRKLNSGEVSMMQMTQALSDIFGIRGKRAAEGLIQGFDEMLQIQANVDASLGSVGTSLDFISKQWGGMAREAATSLDKVKTTVGLIFGAGVVGPIVKSFNKNVLQKVSDSLTSDEYWNTVSNKMYSKVEAVFEPLTKKMGELVSVSFFPDITMSEGDREAKIKQLVGDINSFFKPVAKLLIDGFKAIGRTAGKSLIEGITEMIPGVKSLEKRIEMNAAMKYFYKQTPKMSERAERFKQAKSLYETGVMPEGVPKSAQGGLTGFVGLMKELGLKPTESTSYTGEFESVPRAGAEAKMNNAIAGIVQVLTNDKTSMTDVSEKLDNIGELSWEEAVRVANSMKESSSKPSTTNQRFSVGQGVYGSLEEAAKVAGSTGTQIELKGKEITSSVKELVVTMNSMLDDLVDVVDSGNVELKEQWQRRITDLRVNRK